MGPVRLSEIRECGGFDFRWPATTEGFVSGWEGTASANGRTFRFVHGLGERLVYGQRRPHTVTFIDGDAVVEGVAADDWQASGCLLSLIKPWRGHALARRPEDVPGIYESFDVVRHDVEIDAPYSKRCLALKIRVDDLDAWAVHAIVRRETQGRL